MDLPITQQKLIVASAVYLLATANVTFVTKLLAVYPATAANLGFLMTLPVVMCGVLVILMTPLCYRSTCRPVLSLFLLTGALAAYFTDQLGVVIDDTMIRNIVESNAAEATDLVTLKLLLHLTLLGIVPTLILWRIPIGHAGIWQDVYRNLRLIGATLLVMAACILVFSSHYASFFREHKPLRYFINPTYPLYSVVKHVRRSGGDDRRPLVTIGADSFIPRSDTHRELVILVVGETARADHFSLNGYPRRTNPLLEREDRLFSFTDIESCGTSTAISVPCMFSNMGRQNFDPDGARHSENALDVLQRAGVSVLWRDNNSDSKGVALRVPYENFRSAPPNPICDTECRDEGMLAGLQEYIGKQPGDVLIVLHQMGNHGPAYYKRYPASFERFTPACRGAELSECSQEEIVNSYDNAILYTDYFLSEVIALLKRNTPAYETVMLYISDHGESLGEYGVYLHGMPYGIAPDAQTHVPVLLWLGESADVDMSTINARAKAHSSHDAVFHTLLKVFEIESDSLDSGKALYDTAE